MAAVEKIVSHTRSEAERHFAKLEVAGDQRDRDGKLTAAAKSARQAQRNGVLNTTLNAKALSITGKAYKDQFDAVVPRLIEFLPQVVALLQIGQEYSIYAKAADVGTLPSRKRPLGGEIGPEWIAFIREMEARGVPPSAPDQFNRFEFDFLAQLFHDKTKDARHRHPRGAWMSLVHAGMPEIPVQAWSEDEQQAILRATGFYKEREEAALTFLSEMAGRPLDIPGRLALSIVECATADQDDAEFGFEKNRMTVAARQHDRDLKALMSMLGIDADEIRRADNLRHPSFVRFKEREAQIERSALAAHARRQAETDMYLDAARILVEEMEQEDIRSGRGSAFEGLEPPSSYIRGMAEILADSADERAEWTARGIEMPPRVEVTKVGDLAAEAMMREQAALESEPSASEIAPEAVPAVAAALYDGDPARRGRLWAGLDVAEGTTSGALLIAALEERLAGMGTTDRELARFLGAVRNNRGDAFVADRRAREITRIEQRLRDGDHDLIREVRSTRPLSANRKH